MFCSSCGAKLPDDSVFCPDCGKPVQPATQSAPLSGIDTLMKDKAAQDYWVRRFLAFVVDAIVVFVVITIVAAVVSIPRILLGYSLGSLPLSWIASGAFSALFALIFVLYFTIAEGAYGTSLGKGLFRLRVTTAKGTKPTFLQALVRSVSKIYWALLFLDVVGGLATSKDYKEKLSDRYIRTSVVPR